MLRIIVASTIKSTFYLFMYVYIHKTINKGRSVNLIDNGCIYLHDCNGNLNFVLFLFNQRPIEMQKLPSI